eukprot:747593-Hanusia_phi.AAC.6
MEWISVLSFEFSDGSYRDFHLEPQSDHLQRLSVEPILTDCIKLNVRASFASFRVGLAQLGARGYKHNVSRIFVEPQQKLAPALFAVARGGTLGMSEGIFEESVIVDKPISLVAMARERVQMVQTDPSRPVIVCCSPGLPSLCSHTCADRPTGVTINGVFVALGGDVSSLAPPEFRMDRLAPGVLGAHWEHEQGARDAFGEYDKKRSLPGDEGQVYHTAAEGDDDG